MLKYCVFQKDRGFCEQEDLSKISDFIANPTNIVWLDALDPTQEDMNFLAEEFGFHPLAIEDYFTPHPRPKIDEFPGYYYIVVHALSYSAGDEEINAEELSMFVGPNYIVTAHEVPLQLLDRVADTWQKDPRLVSEGAGMLLYDIMDGLVDSYFPIMDEIEDQLDDIEDAIFSQTAPKSAESIFKLKRSLLVFRRITTPLRDVLNTLIRRDQPLFTEKALTYLRDVYDHTLRIVDTVDTYRDILTGAMDAYLTVISNQLNTVMKTLTVVATVLISAQVISGIYGMNFKFMPELGWRYGYLAALGLMVAVALGLLHYFKRIKWL
jgi:magnesium transporter